MDALRNVRVVTPDGVIENGFVRWSDGAIVAVGVDTGAPTGQTALPGFIDVHVHGGGGHDFMEATPEALRAICRAHAAFGTTTLFATTITQSNAAIGAALRSAAALVGAETGGARIGGIHLEGPYISPLKPGAQPKEFVRDFDTEEFAGWLTDAAGTLRRITLAPERPHAVALIAACLEANIAISFGHTDASADQLRTALTLAEAADATHLFNAMNGIHHRTPGPIPVFLTDPRAMVELIADGHHLAPEVVALAVAAKGTEGVLAITDAMAGAGAPEGVYDLGGHAVTVAGGCALLADGTLAGSVLTMDQAARNLRDWCGLGWSALARVTSTNAAERHELTDRGRLVVGALADLVVVDDSLSVQATYVGGTKITL